MHVANCEYLLLSISCKMNADQSLFVVDLNERRGDRTYLVWSISILLASSVVVQPGLSGTWSGTPKTGFLTTRLISSLNYSLGCNFIMRKTKTDLSPLWWQFVDQFV